MFLALIVLSMCLGSLASVSSHPLIMWGGVACGVALIPPMVAMFLCINRGGVIDLFHGGGAWIRESPYRVSWVDWSILVTRKGALDAQAGIVHLRRSVLFGLIPRERHEWRLDEIGGVEKNRRVPESESLTVVTHEVNLLSTAGGSYTALDLTAGAENDYSSEDLIGRLAAALGRYVGPGSEANAPP